MERYRELFKRALLIIKQAERRVKRYDTPTVNVYSFLIDETLDIPEFLNG